MLLTIPPGWQVQTGTGPGETGRCGPPATVPRRLPQWNPSKALCAMQVAPLMSPWLSQSQGICQLFPTRL